MKKPPATPVLAIVGQGAVTPIGFSAAQMAASWVGLARRFTRVTLDGHADPLTVAECQGVTTGLTGEARLLAMLPSALTEALNGFEPPRAGGGRAVQLLVLPEWLSESTARSIEHRFTALLDGTQAWSRLMRQTMLLRSGATGTWDALGAAYRAINQDAAVEHVLIACVDTQCSLDRLEALASQDALLRPGNGEGFVASEAAACVVLRRFADVTQLPAGVHAAHPPASRSASTAFWPVRGSADTSPLAESLTDALVNARMGPRHISHLCSDADGSSWRAEIESHALTRSVFHESPPKPQWRPAELLGQTGTPAGLLARIVASEVDRHRVERVNTMLSWAIDPSGRCAATVLERAAR